ncbi:MAG: glycosyltransferase [Chloroflexi bacterium]|nr:glycosyltransferase [Chloroflexota bacterium]
MTRNLPEQRPAFCPSVSVIIPVYNGAETIAACLESLLQQEYPAGAYDVIVVENGSTDNTSRIVEKYPVRLFHSEKRGPASARNFGLAQSQADIIAFTDADCIADPNWLAELVKPYAEAEIGGVGGSILAHVHPAQTLVEKFSEEHSPLVNFISGAGEFLPHLYTANASYRRPLLEAVGGFNACLITGEDVDLAWRLQLQNRVRLGFASQAIIYHQHRSTKAGLARQYRQYGFGEILLDTLYGKHSGYPRTRGFQLRRILSQMAALPRYAISVLLRQTRLMLKQINRYEATAPALWFLIESNNVRGKLDALFATRFMTDARPILQTEAAILITRYFPQGKE